MKYWGLVLICLAAAVLTGCGETGEKIGIYVAGSNGDAPAWISGASGIPTWSPDGKWLAWGSESGVQLVAHDGSASRLLVDDAVAGRPSWSPDGTRIAYLNEQNATLSIVNVESGQTTLTMAIATSPSGESSVEEVDWGGPAWSPDGAQLSFDCWDGAGDELCVVDVDGENLRQITRLQPARGGSTLPARDVTATSNVGPSAWSPDGRFLAVAAYPERSGAPTGVFLIDLQRSTARQLTKLLPNSEIRWTPDGKALVYSATEKNRSDVVRVNTNDGSVTKMTSQLAGGARNPAVSPDGSRIAVSSHGDIFVVNDADQSLRVGTVGLKDNFPAWNASTDAIAFMATEDPLVKYD